MQNAIVPDLYPTLHWEIRPQHIEAFEYRGHQIVVSLTGEIADDGLHKSVNVQCDGKPVNIYETPLGDLLLEAIYDDDFSSKAFKESLALVLDDHFAQEGGAQ